MLVLFYRPLTPMGYKIEANIEKSKVWVLTKAARLVDSLQVDSYWGIA
jgi:hypothetical protein